MPRKQLTGNLREENVKNDVLGRLGSSDDRFSSPQSDTSLQATGTGLVHRVVCLFTSEQLASTQIILPAW